MKVRTRVLLAALVATTFIVAITVDSIRWRARVVIFKASGKIPELGWRDIIAWMRPNSPVNLYGLGTSPNPHATIANPDLSDLAAELGKHLYSENCSHCHGQAAEGYTAPNLVAALAGGMSDWSFFNTVRSGVAGTPMIAQPLNGGDIWRIHAYLRHLALGSSEMAANARLSRKSQLTPVSFEDIKDAGSHAGEWLTYGGDLGGRRHSALSSITKANVGQLRIEWVSQLRAVSTALEATPIVHDGRIYVSETPDGLAALDALTGEQIWHFRRPLPGGEQLCCGYLNRGVAILGDAVFLSTLDAHLVSLDAASGVKRWDAPVAEASEGYSMTGAPLALRDKIVVGVAGGEYGIRGFVAAFRPENGARLWTFYTVPGPGEAGNQTWAGDSWKTGSAPTWATGAFDPESRTIFWGVGNPSPVYRTDVRAGDNLFSNSVVALDEEGKLRWHYQFTPGDDHDWDSAQQPVLAEIPWEGRSRPVLLWANRNGFFYVLDRFTGQFLLAKPFVKQTWNAGFDAHGKPSIRTDAHPTRTGRLVWPSVVGGTSWWPPSLDPKRLLLYVPTIESASMYFRAEGSGEQAEPFLGSAGQPAGNARVAVALKAIEVSTGNVRWQTRFAEGPSTTYRGMGGVLSTDSGLVFASYRDQFFALDADTGKILRSIHLGGKIAASPISYEEDGRQFVAVLAGNALFSFAVPAKP